MSVKTISAVRSQFEEGWGLTEMAGSLRDKFTPLFIMADIVMDLGNNKSVVAPFDVTTAVWISELEREFNAFQEVLEEIVHDPERVKGGA